MPYGLPDLDLPAAPAGPPPAVIGRPLGHERRFVGPPPRSTDVRQGTAGADRVCEVRFSPPGLGLTWLIERFAVVVEGSATAPQLMVYAGSVSAANFLDGTTDGQLGVAEYPNELVVPANTELLLRWSNADPGSTCTARVQYRVEGH